MAKNNIDIEIDVSKKRFVFDNIPKKYFKWLLAIGFIILMSAIIAVVLIFSDISYEGEKTKFESKGKLGKKDVPQYDLNMKVPEETKTE